MRIKQTSDPDKGYQNKDLLYVETQQHRNDVFRLMSLIALEIIETGNKHDWSKIKYFNEYAQDVQERPENPNFEEREWYKIHTTEERHHLGAEIPEDIDLIDIIEFISDSIVAGKARTGRVEKKYLELPGDILKKAYWNTINKMIKEVK